ncbi:hypothetical protein PYCCODRAFT_1473489 [Trametes coccinea BRFM310]|uniref:Uncharacterized protein n=1 Tax=Trametes coccinea (strain BRFM310) TaxID=1353009 RepID=A0A1Y2J369_TRAC3|nr:hypothetical protein PYCCODRAFT_1473489 [Trametes coccinea BRFM310]
MDNFLVVFSTVLLLLNTVYWTTQTYFGQQMWVVHADFPGGMDGYLNAYVAVWYQTWGTAAITVSNLMVDALMVCTDYLYDNPLIVVFPAAIWLGSFASCLGLLYESGRPNGNYFAGIATSFGTAWNSLIFSFNVIVTSLICGRIVYIGRRVSFSDESTREYTGAVAILVESALPFTIGSMVYVITYGVGSDIAVAFSCYSMFTAISPQLIALRVLMRRAWRKEQAADYLTTINFTDRSQNTSTQVEAKNEHALEKRLERAASVDDPSSSRETNLDIYAV